MTSIFAAGGSGALEGGWEFVWAAYAATWIFFVGYSVSLLWRGAHPPPAPPAAPAPAPSASNPSDEEQP